MTKTIVLSILLLASCAHAGTALRSQDLPNGLVVSNSTPILSSAVFEVRASSAVKSNDYILIVSSQNATIVTTILDSGHIEWSGCTPTVTSCGGGPSIVGNDVVGEVTIGSAPGATCLVTFCYPWTNAPHCLVLDESSILGLRAPSTTAAMTITASVSLTGADKVDYFCPGHR